MSPIPIPKQKQKIRFNFWPGFLFDSSFEPNRGHENGVWNINNKQQYMQKVYSFFFPIISRKEDFKGEKQIIYMAFPGLMTRN